LLEAISAEAGHRLVVALPVWRVPRARSMRNIYANG
jgi:hypothetical protein